MSGTLGADEGISTDLTLVAQDFATKRDEGGSGLGAHIIFNLVKQALNSALYYLASMEAAIPPSKEPHEVRVAGGAFMDLGHKWQGAVVERGSLTYESSLSEKVL